MGKLRDMSDSGHQNGSETSGGSWQGWATVGVFILVSTFSAVLAAIADNDQVERIETILSVLVSWPLVLLFLVPLLRNPFKKVWGLIERDFQRGGLELELGGVKYKSPPLEVQMSQLKTVISSADSIQTAAKPKELHENLEREGRARSSQDEGYSLPSGPSAEAERGRFVLINRAEREKIFGLTPAGCFLLVYAEFEGRVRAIYGEDFNVSWRGSSKFTPLIRIFTEMERRGLISGTDLEILDRATRLRNTLAHGVDLVGSIDTQVMDSIINELDRVAVELRLIR